MFDNSRVVAELGGEAPAKFSTYAYPLLKFSRENKFRYPAKAWPAAAKRHGASGRGGRARMTDFILVAWVSALIGMARVKWMFGRGQRWKPGEKLRLLFAGYNGTRNTGSDVRVNEMLRQIRHVLGAENVDFSVMTQDFGRTKGYFEGTRQVHLPDMFPPFLYSEVRKNHGVIACEGSMFKSKFANALTTMMIGSLGMASAENKLSVGYGGEAGHMDPLIRNMCARYVRRVAGDHAQYGIAAVAGLAGNPGGTGDGHGVDIRAAPAGVCAQSFARGWLGRKDADSGAVPDSSVCLAGESINCEICGAGDYRRL